MARITQKTKQNKKITSPIFKRNQWKHNSGKILDGRWQLPSAPLSIAALWIKGLSYFCCWTNFRDIFQDDSMHVVSPQQVQTLSAASQADRMCADLRFKKILRTHSKCTSSINIRDQANKTWSNTTTPSFTSSPLPGCVWSAQKDLNMSRQHTWISGWISTKSTVVSQIIRTSNNCDVLPQLRSD